MIKNDKGSAGVWVLIIALVLMGGIAYFSQNKNEQNDENIAITSEKEEVKNTLKEENPVSENSPVSKASTKTTDCGAIAYADLVSAMFGAGNSASATSIKCANDALLSCTPAKLAVEGTNTNPASGEQGFNAQTQVYNITVPSKANHCAVSECVVPSAVIKNRSTTEKQNLIFTLVGMGPGIGNNDVYDPVTKSVTKNVCPNTNNPYQAK